MSPSTAPAVRAVLLTSPESRWLEARPLLRPLPIGQLKDLRDDERDFGFRWRFGG